MKIRSPFLRLALLFPVVITCIVVALFAPLYTEAEALLRAEVHAAIEQEIVAIDDHMHDRGMEGLAADLRERIASPVDPDAIYLLTDVNGNPMVGNLDAWPPDLVAKDDAWFRLREPQGQNIEGKMFLLFGGERLLVGRRSPLAPFRESVAVRLWWSGALIIVATALLVGAFMRHLHRRLHRLAEEAATIQRGHLSRRLTIGRHRDELDDLAVRFNQAFDEIERLIESTRHVSSALAHDMRRPLIGLRNELELTIANIPADSPLAGRLQHLVERTEEVLGTFAALLRLARLESGTLEAVRRECDLKQIIEDAVELQAVMAESQGRHIIADLASVSIAGDPDLLFQMCHNIIENALVHGQGDVKIGLVTGEGRTRISVRDHGGGVPDAALPQLFDRFFRVDTSRSSDTGSGIGLALVKGIAEAHGGRVMACNADPGLEVTVELPLAR